MSETPTAVPQSDATGPLRITAERSYLAKGIQQVARAVSTRQSLPVLSNILLETREDSLFLTATDLDAAIRVRIPAAIGTSGTLCLPAQQIADITGKLPDAPVTIEDMDGKADIRCGKSQFTLLTLPTDDYPVVPMVQFGEELTLPNTLWRRLIELTAFAAAKDVSRSLLMGVLLEAEGSTLRFVATDTHRLVYAQAALSTPVAAKVATVIPAKVLEHVAKSLDGDGETMVRIGGSEWESADSPKGVSQVQFETIGGATFLSRVLDGQFPNYDKVIPKESPHSLTFSREEMLGAVKRAYIVAKGGAEKVVLTVADGAVQLTAEASDVGKAFEEVNADVVCDTEKFQIAFNGRYLLEFLEHLGGSRLQLRFNGALNPALLVPVSVGEDGKNETTGVSVEAVVMPMQV